MIIGIGIDIVELERIEQLLTKQPRFVQKVLTKEEQSVYQKLAEKRKIEFMAGRFAAKEAFVKACGTGISKEFGWQDIEVLNEVNGKPVLTADIEAAIHISISHSEKNAVAQVILERLSS
ncbi:4'-phosphopantetheinyl transferase [Alkalihalophilus pseudofirmus OF4]|uniref:Holo-[acyl-carrier-protein] synthase n=1 Tax=Alkalihalophilus pseudofirmus (strain ATCC BAA-2126 / JCM 17055 / OF4) TaxID=398511 RepID=D3FRX7_ALKPO|nr:holo-ACP synthase [Alkalihalophilus pseudofirmus]ADC49887.1 4'-phosphopantetheinyl transferase [Alkalihalophilus pseudofirmus OF4]